jgi:hypothetical protein
MKFGYRTKLKIYAFCRQEGCFVDIYFVNVNKIRIDMAYCFELQPFQSFNLYLHASPMSSCVLLLSIVSKLVHLLLQHMLQVFAQGHEESC